MSRTNKMTKLLEESFCSSKLLVYNSVHDRSDKGKKKVRVGDISEEYTKEELEIARSLKERKQNESMRREQIMKHELDQLLI